MKKSLAIIPCKTDSTRVKKKNLQIINGLTLLEITIKYAKESKLVDTIYISTESEEVSLIADKYEIPTIPRGKDLLGDAEVCDVYVDVIRNLSLQKKIKISNYEYVVGLQPDHPDRDNSLDELIKYAYENKYDDLFTVSEKYVRTGSVRILRMNHISKGFVSRRVGSFKGMATNIHSLDDLKKAEKRLINNN